MTASEKYINMNNLFVKLRDAIFDPNAVDEKDEDKHWEDDVKGALFILVNYLDYYKQNNNIKSHVKEN